MLLVSEGTPKRDWIVLAARAETVSKTQQHRAVDLLDIFRALVEKSSPMNVPNGYVGRLWRVWAVL